MFDFNAAQSAMLAAAREYAGFRADAELAPETVAELTRDLRRFLRMADGLIGPQSAETLGRSFHETRLGVGFIHTETFANYERLDRMARSLGRPSVQRVDWEPVNENEECGPYPWNL